jgi:hypothetical protein
VVFTQPPRKTTSLTGNNIQRQPLRPLNNAHNTHINPGAQKGDKPLKAFSVYTDKSRTSGHRSPNAGAQTIRKANSTSKRTSDLMANARPTKMVRPNPTTARSAAELSASKIEELIERKVSEALASRVIDRPASAAPTEISEAVQRRLEALERKIESGEAEEARAEGLRFLLMAKQHKERGEDTSALKMYEMALPFFPGQEKLLKKIDNLRAKIQAKRAEAAHFSAPLPGRQQPIALFSAPSFETAHEQETKPQRQKSNAESDDEYNGSEIQQEDYNDDDSFSYKPSRPKKPMTTTKPAKSALRIFSDDADSNALEPPSPRTRHLLDIVNSRNIAMIKGLSGVGAKKARDLVEFLELQSEDEGGNITSLRQLQEVPGLGVRTVERAYEGIGALLA